MTKFCIKSFDDVKKDGFHVEIEGNPQEIIQGLIYAMKHGKGARSLLEKALANSHVDDYQETEMIEAPEKQIEGNFINFLLHITGYVNKDEDDTQIKVHQAVEGNSKDLILALANTFENEKYHDCGMLIERAQDFNEFRKDPTNHLIQKIKKLINDN